MKNRLKKCLLACLLFPLTACAHYYQGSSGYYPNGGGYGGWHQNYYGYAPSQNYRYFDERHGNYPNYRQQFIPSFPHRDHDGWRQQPQQHHEERNNRYGFNQRNHDYGDRNPGRQQQFPQSNYPRYQQQEGGRDNNNRGNHQERGNDMQGHHNHRRGHDD
jgi:hypothetical protein